MRIPLAAALLLLAGLPGATRAQGTSPFERPEWPIPANTVDRAVVAGLQAAGLSPAAPCSDAVFIRRVYLDLMGTLPEPVKVREFLLSPRPDKRSALIDALLQTPEFTDYATLKWCDLLRVKSEFPINLWPNAVQAYHHWVHEAVRDNLPCDQLARALLTSSGSSFRVGPVNFYRAVQGREPAALAAAVALTFMGTRLASWPPEQASRLAAFFSRLSYKKTGEWKEEVVCLDPAPHGPLATALPDGTAVTIPADQDPRRVFADWLLAPGNEWFARCAANRVWYWLMGRGVIQEPDDIRPAGSPAGANPPSNPALLACLERALVESHYDLRALYRLILNSRTYQQSPVPAQVDARADALFAHYLPRRLDAEVLVDALQWLGGPAESYVSPIPEPFTVLPKGTRAITLTDGSISSPLLEMFGRPSRDTGLASERDNAPTDAQRRFLLNATDVQRTVQQGPRVRWLLATSRRDPTLLAGWVYLTVLSRDPTAAELAAARQYLLRAGTPLEANAADLAWALLNTKEFLYRH
jgi:hypothetical protein